MITSEKWAALKVKMASLDLRDADIIEQFILGSGAGGQKINKTHSCVYLKHTPTGIELKCQKSRSRDDNRFFARRRLCEKIDELINNLASEKKQAIMKISRQKKRRSRRAKQKMMDDKSHRGNVKGLRKKAGFDAE